MPLKREKVLKYHFERSDGTALCGMHNRSGLIGNLQFATFIKDITCGICKWRLKNKKVHMNTEDMIDVTGIDFRVLIQESYRLSKPQGLGFLHYNPQDLTEKEIDNIIDKGGKGLYKILMDYVKGRSVKLNVYNINGRHYIDKDWYDHTPAQFQMLLDKCGIEHNL